MTELLGESLSFGYAQLMHIVRMMYWVWVPGFLLSAFLSLRYRDQAREGLLAHGKEGFATTFPWVLWYGITASPRPRSTLGDAHRLLEAGAAPALAMAVLVASRNLPLYLVALLTLHLGIEFAVGHAMGTLAMAALVYAGVTAFPVAEGQMLPGNAKSLTTRPSSLGPGIPLVPASWGALLFRGWARALGYCWTELKWFWPGLALGILLGGFILAAGLTKWWVELADAGGGRIASDLINAAVAPFLGGLLSLPPVGNLPAGTALFKTDALAYPGFVGFILASSLRVTDLRAYRKLWGARGTARLAIVFYAAAFLGGLFPVGVFAFFGFRPGHIPLFNTVVEEIIRWVPFALPSGGMGM